MKFNKKIIVVLVLLFLSQSGVVYAWSIKGLVEYFTKEEEKKPEEKEKAENKLEIKKEDIKKDEKENLQKMYPGTWFSAGIYYGDKLINTKQNTLVLTAKDFSLKSGACEASGSIYINGDNLTLSFDKFSCLEKPPFSLVGYKYEVLKNGKLLILQRNSYGSKLKEVYKRIK